ncbi:hypothetical protein [Streptomyces sp. NPDC056527]|uniref:hypothetical protein n=1 Tax=Streptomyces sp. NPDC056527 TaxID=3345853 RepID=UPI0036B338BF
MKRTTEAERWAPASSALYLVAGIVMAIGIGIAAFPVGSAEEPDRNPSGSSTVLYPEPDGSPSESHTASITEPEAGSTPTPSPPLGSNGLNTAGGRPRETRDNDSYYDGNYDNDDEWHRDHGNPDEYYDGNYENDDDYHRKYGRE